MAEIEIIKGADNGNPPDTLRQMYPKANRNFTRINNELTEHKNSSTAHPAQNIPYSGAIIGAENTKQALDKLKQEINDLVLGGDDSDPNTRAEVEVARGGHDTLGDRLDSSDAQLADTVLKPSQTTAEIQSALNNAVKVVFTAGTYTLDPITVPSTVKSISSVGYVKFIPGPSVTNIVPVSWVTFNSLSDANVGRFYVEVDETLYPYLRCLDFTTCSNVLVKRIRAKKGGGIAIYGANCIDVTIEKCKVDTFAQRGIHLEGALQIGNAIVDNVVNGQGSAHGISAQLGESISVRHNKVKNSKVFGIGLYQVRDSDVSENKTHNTGHEGINIEDCNTTKIIGNTCTWDVGIGNDFGISVFGNAADEQFDIVANNIVINSHKSGICLAGRVNFAEVTNNQVLNCNRGNVADNCGILLYGSDCVKNKVTDNIVTDTLGTLHVYGIGECDFGTGTPTLNEITGNTIEGYIVDDIKTTNKTTLTAMNTKDLAGFRAYTPVVGSTVGAITTSSANGYYLQMGKIIFFYLTATITTNGTGAGALTISLPFVPVRGGGSGKELAVSGKALTLEIGATINAQVRTYDNNYPATNGSIIQISGMYEVA